MQTDFNGILGELSEKYMAEKWLGRTIRSKKTKRIREMRYELERVL